MVHQQNGLFFKHKMHFYCLLIICTNKYILKYQIINAPTCFFVSASSSGSFDIVCWSYKLLTFRWDIPCCVVYRIININNIQSNTTQLMILLRCVSYIVYISYKRPKLAVTGQQTSDITSIDLSYIVTKNHIITEESINTVKQNNF
jgi:hypothetical protein